MAYDLPDRAAIDRYSAAAFAGVKEEMLAERAASVGHHGRQVETALAALRAFDPATGTPEHRLALVRKAAREVWAFLVQRELCGLRDQKQIIKDYAIPGEVVVRLGAIEPHR
ncbi:MAG: DUF6665 family protein [Devosia sp.]